VAHAITGEPAWEAAFRAGFCPQNFVGLSLVVVEEPLQIAGRRVLVQREGLVNFAHGISEAG
jgi:hypothetical protein